MNDIQIIGVDLAREDSKDYSCITGMCSKCRTVFESKPYNPNINELALTYYKSCPVCGAKFTKHKLLEEI